MNIEDGIPIPGKSVYKTPLTLAAEKMECGNSVVLNEEGQVATLRKWMRRHGRKVVVRKMDGGWRAWRTE